MPESASSATHQSVGRRWLPLILVFSICQLTGVHATAQVGRPSPVDVVRPRSDLKEPMEQLLKSTVFIRSADDSASGVLISESGLILTTAHGVSENSAGTLPQVAVVLHDQTTLKASVLRADRKADLALLRLDSPPSQLPAPLTIADTGELSRLQLNSTPVLAAGFPGRERGTSSAVVRLGEIIFQDAGSFRTTCTLTAGDSGGPLIRPGVGLIGVHWRIGAATDHNQHISASLILEFVADWSDELPVPSKAAAGPGSDKVPQETPAVAAELRRRIVQLAARSPGAETLIDLGIGTLLDDRRVAAKLSRLNDASTILCRIEGAKEYSPAQLIAHSRTDDLAILQLATGADAKLSFNPVNKAGAGDIVYSSGFARGGIVSRTAHEERSLPLRFGASFMEDESVSGLLVTDVAPNSTAYQCGILKGDQLLSITPLHDVLPTNQNLDDLEDLFRLVQPGDWVRVQFRRDQQIMNGTGQLSINPASEFERTEFLDGRSGRLSARRSGFDNVFQHDIPISPETCGGPVLNSSGELIGINIARRSREATLALPISTVLNLSGKSLD